MKGLLLGSVTNSVLALCDKPVLILRNKPAPTNDSLKVGVAIDGSKYGEAAVEHILKNHDIFGDHPTFYLMNVVSDYAGVVMPDMAGMALPTMMNPKFAPCSRNLLMKPSARAVKLSKTKASRQKKSAWSAIPGDEIAAFAKNEGLDLIVMGNTRLRRFQSRRPRFDRYAYCRDQ